MVGLVKFLSAAQEWAIVNRSSVSELPADGRFGDRAWSRHLDEGVFGR
jgi:hypothetical protein